MAKHRAFTAIETLLTLGIIAVTTGLSVPMYRNFQIRNDLDLVTEQTIQGLRRAQVLAQSGESDSAWGFYVQDGVLYQGEAYAVRDAEYDEHYPVPPTINTSGLSEVSFSRIEGSPSQTGEVIIQAINGETRVIVVGLDGVYSSTGIQDAVEEGSSGGGSTSGGSTSGGSTSGGSTSGGSTSGGSTSGGSSSGGSGSGGSSSGGSSGGSEPSCEDRFAVADDGQITTTGNVNAVFTVLGSQITYGAGGPEVQVHVDVSTNGGTTWMSLFNGADVDGGETETVSNIPNGSQVLLRVNGRYSWLFNKTYISNNSDGHIEVLRNGDLPPDYEAFDNQNDLASFLGTILQDGVVGIGEYDAVFLAELGDLNESSADFQDAVIQVTFSQPEGSCSTSDDPRFKVHFNRVENVGQGDAQNKVYVGEQGMLFGEDEWIPLINSGVVLVDNFLSEDVPGLAAWRSNGYLRVLLHGSHSLGSKEIVDATVSFQNAGITSVENDTGQNKTENPFDSIVNDGAGGDEVTVAADNLSVSYQARVTTADDGIFIHWEEQDGAGVDEGGSSGGSSSGGSDEGTGGESGDESGNDATDSSEDSDSDSGGGDTDETPDPCAVAYTITSDGKITINEPADVTFRVRGSHMTYGTRGPEIRSYVSASFDGGEGWQSLFGFRDVDGGERQTFTDIASGSQLVLRAEGRYSWLFRSHSENGDGTGRVKVLKRKDPLPGTTPYSNVGDLKDFMRSLIDGNRVNIGKTSLLLLFELQDLSSDSDYQDLATEVILEKPAGGGICGSSDDGDESGDEGSGGDDSASGESSSSGGSSGSSSSDGSSEGDSGEKMTICHFPPGNKNNPQTLSISSSAWKAHQKHGDREGACESDADGDTIANSQDLCPDTYTPEEVPTAYMLFKKFALTSNSPIFRKGPRKKVSEFTLEDTRGCSCEQLVDVAEGKKAYHFDQFPRLLREVQSLFPFYTEGARNYGCGIAIIQMVKNFE